MLEIIQTGKTISAVHLDRLKYNLQPTYQRGSVWSRDNQQYLIDSILRGYDLPKIYLAKPGERASEGMRYDVVDGQQRLTAIFAFLDGELELGDTSGRDKIQGHDLSGMKYEDLPELFANRISGFSLSMSIIEDASREEIENLFLRLQEGKQLNPAEKRHAKDCTIGDVVRRCVEHKFMEKKLKAPDKRYSHQDWIAHVARLISEDGPTDLSAASLMKMYEASKDGLVNSEAIEKKLKSVLNSLVKCFADDKVPELDIKWGFVDLSMLIMKLQSQYVINDEVLGNVGEFYKKFELERRRIKDPESLLSPSYAGEFDGKLLFDYREKFVREGMKKESLRVRSEVYFKAFIGRHPNLRLKDPTRAFTSDERLIIWRLANEQCAACKTKITFEECQADHIEAHSKGGSTALTNAQCLCGPCNRQKGNR